MKEKKKEEKRRKRIWKIVLIWGVAISLIVLAAKLGLIQVPNYLW